MDLLNSSVDESAYVAPIYEIRRQNLVKLAKKQGSIAKINEALGRKRADAYLYAIVARGRKTNGRIKNLGTEIARKIEAAYSLPLGWMDLEHQDQNPPEPAQNAAIISNEQRHSAPMPAAIGAHEHQAAYASDAAGISPLSRDCALLILDKRLMPPAVPPGLLRWIEARSCGLDTSGYLLIDIAARDLARPGDYLLERMGLSYPVYAARRSSLDLACGARISAIGGGDSAPLAALDLSGLSVVGRIAALVSSSPLP